MFAAVIFLTGSDANREPIFFGRQRAGGEGGKGAGRIFSLVEIEHDFAVLGRCGGQKAASPIGFLASSQVSYYEKSSIPPSSIGSSSKVRPSRVNTALPGTGVRVVCPIMLVMLT